MVIGILIIARLLCLGQALGQVETNTNTTLSLFADHKSSQVGEIITVYIMEFSSGSNQAGTSTSRKSEQGFDGSGSGSLAKYAPAFGAALGKNSDFDGLGSTHQKANLQAKMSVQITEILENGNYKIEGRREVDVNGDKQTMILTGTIRPQDITADNIVYSYYIADAQISYKGKGPVNQGQRPGWLFRIINWIL